jgi:hypothetical protein
MTGEERCLSNFGIGSVHLRLNYCLIKTLNIESCEIWKPISEIWSFHGVQNREFDPIFQANPGKWEW